MAGEEDPKTEKKPTVSRRDRGSGSLAHVGKDSWEFRVSSGRDPVTGKRRRPTYLIKAKTKTEARQKANALLTDLDTTPLQGSKVSLQHLLDEFIVSRVQKSREAKTIDEYKGKIRRDISPYPIANMPINKIGVKDLEDHYAVLADTRGLSAQSISHVHSLIRAAMNQAVRWSWLKDSPTAQVELEKIPTFKPKIPTPEESDRIFLELGKKKRNGKVVTESHVMAAVISAATACRRSELVALRWSDINFEDKVLTFDEAYYSIKGDEGIKDTKTDQVRHIPLSDSLADALAAWKVRCDERAAEFGAFVEPDGYVCSGDPVCSEPLRPDSITQSWGRAAKRAGLEGVRFQDLRHAGITQMLAAGIPVKDVAKIAGHTTAMTLTKYGGPTSSQLRAGAEVLGRSIPKLGIEEEVDEPTSTAS